MDSKTTVPGDPPGDPHYCDESPPLLDTELLDATVAAAELSKVIEDASASEGADVLAAGEQGSGRLSSIVPTLGRFATRAHQASAPYLSYAAMASQEAARYDRLLL